MSFASYLAAKAAIFTAAIVGTATFAAPAGAAVFTVPLVSIPLTSLIGTGSTIDLGGVTFSNFTVSNDSGDMPPTSSVTITPEFITIGSQNTVGFRVAGGFVDSGASAGASDFQLSYEVATDDGSATITDAHLQGNPAVIGNGFATVTDTWLPDVTDGSITISRVNQSTPTLAASIDFSSPFSHLSAQKDILLFVADGSANLATLSFADQTFSTTPNGSSGTPEPASLGLLGLGAMSLLARRRR